MKKWRLLLLILIPLVFPGMLKAADDGRDTPPNTNQRGPSGQNTETGDVVYGTQKDSGFYVGGDSGVFAPLGGSSDVLSVQFLSAVTGGYSVKRRFNFQLRLLQGIGQLDRNSSTTFLFMTEFDTKINFLKRGFSPYILGGIGFYVLSFSGFDPLISKDTNLTYVGGGGFDYLFGSNSVGLGVNYRGFLNATRNFQGLEVTVNYAYHFF